MSDFATRLDLIAADIEGYLAEVPASKELLPLRRRCGSVDDGKSTLIGRLLYDDGACVFEDQLAALEEGHDAPRQDGRGASTSRCSPTGCTAEREQGITIDVAYRYFSTAQAQVHHRRHAGARAVHAQHGDGRVHQRTWRSS